MKRCAALVAMLVGATLLATTAPGCKAKTSDKDLQFVEPERADALLRERSGLLGLGKSGRGAWVDPRTRAEYDAEHIPGAIHLPYDQVREEYEKLLEYPVIIVYGRTYNSAVAASMSKTLRELGVSNVHTLRGGLEGWKATGGAVETTSAD